MTPSEAQLVRASRQTILSTGISEPYFDAHFKLAQVFDSISDRRVVWRFTTGEHEATLIDSIGFYTDARGRRVYTHTVGQTLVSAHDIRRTITRRQAERIMKSCIGEFESGGVVYQATGRPPRAALVFTALSLPPPETPPATKSATPAPASPSASSAPAAGSSAQMDIVKPGGKKKPFLLTGGVNLETGRCTKGLAQVGSPLPPRPERPARTRQ
ncbi:MAG TPA: hypothetical protein VGV59_01200 [Pyrinomonadaceae bacterium]|nr:hypothetical protein [Pyrinomonadaceae bacterium]